MSTRARLTARCHCTMTLLRRYQLDYNVSCSGRFIVMALRSTSLCRTEICDALVTNSLLILESAPRSVLTQRTKRSIVVCFIQNSPFSRAILGVWAEYVLTVRVYYNYKSVINVNNSNITLLIKHGSYEMLIKIICLLCKR